MLSSFRRHLLPKPMLGRVGSTVQVSEFDKPTDVVTHCPSIETGFPFHLDAFLYEHPPDLTKATECHDAFRKMIHNICGARVWTVREILSGVPLDKLRNFLVDFSSIHFCISPGSQSQEVKHKEKKEYIKYSLSNLSADELVDLILLHPSLTFDVDKSTSRFTYRKIPLSPLANLTFTRDQQITTAKGVVIGRFGAIQRAPENDLMSIVWPQIGVNPIGRIKNPGKLEGGDFIILGKHTSMMGVGLRSNFYAAQQLMNEDLLGTDRFIVVEDKVDCNQQRMHLDTFFNVLDDKLCVCVDTIADDDPKYIRIAHEFVKSEKGYVEKRAIPFGQWLKDEKFTVIKSSFKQQEDYFINLLHLGRDSKGKNHVLAINSEVEKVAAEYGFNGEVHYLDFSPITCMYGGAHCASQVLRAPGII